MKVEISQIPVIDNPPRNLSWCERKALRELKCDTELDFYKADKELYNMGQTISKTPYNTLMIPTLIGC